MTAPKSICLRGHAKPMGIRCIQCKRIFSVRHRRSLSNKRRGWNSLRDNAARKGLIIGISFQEFEKFFEQDCYYCGESFERGKCSYSLDRIDNTLGYLKDNVVACCYACNHAKASLTKDQFIGLCQLIASRFPVQIS